MAPVTINEVARWCGGEVVGAGDSVVRRLHTDSRTLQPGDCFVALRGDRFDAHDFVPKLDPQLAPAALVERRSGLPRPRDLALIVVDDTLRALQKAAASWRAGLGVRVTGVTGSAGKTSTKEMIASVLNQGFRTQATAGNLNNHIGVPLTLLALEADIACAVVEMGMNHPGEIAPLAELAAPACGVITGIGTAHIEFFPDQRGIATEKAALIEALPENGVAVLNADDPWTEYVASRTKARVVLAGLSEKAAWRATNVRVTEKGVAFSLHHQDKSVAVTLPVFGRVMVNNALLAAAVGGEHGLSLEQIARGLSTVVIPGARMKPEVWNDGWILNDVYNANAESMEAALETLREFPSSGRKVAVLGSMGELGDRAVELHERVGRKASEMGLDWLICVGPNAADLARGAKNVAEVRQAVDAEGAARHWRILSRPGDTVLVKGSRFMQLERAVAALRAGKAGV